MNDHADRARPDDLGVTGGSPVEPTGLSDDELEVELTIAAYAPGRMRWDKYERLLVERIRRRREFAGAI